MDEMAMHNEQTATTTVPPTNSKTVAFLSSGLGTDFSVIPGGYTCVPQLCDVSVNKPITKYFRAHYDD
ncbi:Pogo transposable element with KRAB domain-like [Phytophthora palmivora]|uniref:Pogo transposable element with KRAB domain-like n=1 Tax=Phytophthora palmivora TaxID=4796 RepID=A0A2P4Y8Z9_9STRA|nr:Pogo transposable element with KRAB domain-like [Phytophthora palmivora]